MSFPKHEKYKDSGVEWLGEIPSDWISIRLKRRACILTEKSDRRKRPIGLENVEGWTGRFVDTETGRNARDTQGYPGGRRQRAAASHCTNGCT